MRKYILLAVIMLFVQLVDAAIVVQDGEVIAVSAPIGQAEESLLPLRHESGVYYWIIDEEHGSPFFDSNSNVYPLYRRTLADIQATPEYQDWIFANPENLPALWVDVTITPQDAYFQGSSGLYAFPNDSTGAFQVSASVYLDEAKTMPLTQIDGMGWVFIINKILPRTGQVFDTVRPLKFFVTNTCTFVLSPDTMDSGRYSLDEEDFAHVEIGGQKYQFNLIAPNSPDGRRAIEFDVYDAGL